MKKIEFSWPEGKTGSFTTSWDDGSIHDRRLVEIMNRNGIKGTWNLCSGFLDDANSLSKQEVKELFEGHEVAVHGFDHPSLDKLSEEAVRSQIILDRIELEKLVDYPVTGLALPYGAGGQRVLTALSECGIKYSRPTTKTGAFAVPDDFMDWHTTCHIADNLQELWNKFLENKASDKLFYLWGHSSELPGQDDWGKISDFFEKVAEAPNIWHATNKEIYTYVSAWRKLEWSMDLSCLNNTSGTELWLKVDGDLVKVAPGSTMRI